MKTLLTSLSLSLLISSGVFAQTYKIQFDRPMKPGEKYNIVASGTQSQAMTVTSDGKTLQEQKEEFSVDYKSVEEVLEVDSLGRETKISSTIEKFTKTTGGVTKDMLPKGTVLVSSAPNVHLVNGVAVDPDVAKALSMAVQLSKGGPGDDTIFGTREAKKIGDSWDADATAMKEDLSKTFGGAVQDFAGKTTLVNVVKSGSGDVLKIQAKVTGKVVPPLPPGFTVDASAMEVTLAGDLPVDLSLGRPMDSTAISFTFSGHADAPTGAKIVMDMKMHGTQFHGQTRVSP